MLIDRNDDACRIETKLPCSTVQDALIGLMRYEPVNIRRIIACLGQSGVDHLADLGHCMAKYLRTVHADMSDGAGGRRTAIDIELVAVAAVGAKARGEDAP